MPISLNSVDLPTGVRLQYAEHGDPAGMPVLMLHGWSDSWRSFEPVLPHLPASIRAISVTQRGHGDSSKPESGYALEDFTADVVALLDALEIDRAIVAGHSMGSLFAQRVAIDHPERVAGLVLMGSQRTFEVPQLQELYEYVAQMTDPVDPVFIREFQESTIARAIPEGMIDWVVAESQKLTARVWQGSMGALRTDFSAETGKIAAPTLIVAGERDEVSPPDAAEALAAAIPGARLLMYADAGHAMHWEEPACFAADVVAFVATISPVLSTR